MKTTTILLPITHTLDTDLIYFTKALAKQHGAKLICLYITSPLSLTNCYTYPSLLYSIANLNVDLVQMAQEDMVKRINALLNDCEHETLCLIGPTTDTIISVAKQKEVDLIVIPKQKESTHSKFVISPKDKLQKKCQINVIEYTK
ncbi:MAG: universal stress protein [Niameybacter sp.]|uniref:universal stress protein n=1 Tax=Niameybacter sp. TaxID=2033640 RepID=UPI002FC8F425